MATPTAMQQLVADPGFLVSRVGAMARAGFKQVLEGWGIRPQQYVILLVLDSGGGLSQQELCTATAVDSGNMVELLDGLEALRYAERTRDPRDRRRYLVTITPPGRLALAGLRQAVAEDSQRFLSPLTGPEQQELAASLGKLFTAAVPGWPGGAA